MPLYIRHDEVDALAMELQALIGASTKTEAVKRALECEIRTKPRNYSAAGAFGFGDRQGARDETLRPDFDMKQFTDDLWGE